MTSISRNAPKKPISGENAPGTITFSHTPFHCTPLEPDYTNAAPRRPPISACVELEGKPSHQVARFQAIAPISAASTVFSVARPVSISPWPTVFATAVVPNAPARFETADTATAIRGESARVPTHVAT